MPVTLTVANIPYAYPSPGDSPGWGEAATGWAEGVTLVLDDLLGSNDILETPFTIANNVSSFTNIIGLSFNTGEVRSANITYSIYRTSTANPSGSSESGIINITYDNLAGAGSVWSFIQYGMNGNAGVLFTITDAGQLQYKSSNINSTGYSGTIHFRASVLGQ